MTHQRRYGPIHIQFVQHHRLAAKTDTLISALLFLRPPRACHASIGGWAAVPRGTWPPPGTPMGIDGVTWCCGNSSPASGKLSCRCQRKQHCLTCEFTEWGEGYWFFTCV